MDAHISKATALRHLAGLENSKSRGLQRCDAAREELAKVLLRNPTSIRASHEQRLLDETEIAISSRMSEKGPKSAASGSTP